MGNIKRVQRSQEMREGQYYLSRKGPPKHSQHLKYRVENNSPIHGSP